MNTQNNQQPTPEHPQPIKLCPAPQKNKNHPTISQTNPQTSPTKLASLSFPADHSDYQTTTMNQVPQKKVCRRLAF
jgi:hypothetical protein